jgi:hypothetical protein
MKGKSKDYIKGFRHGTAWAEIWLVKLKEIDEEVFYKAVKEAIKSLEAGR